MYSSGGATGHSSGSRHAIQQGGEAVVKPPAVRRQDVHFLHQAVGVERRVAGRQVLAVTGVDVGEPAEPVEAFEDADGFEAEGHWPS